MNVFVTSKCPLKAANYLDNKRVNKMLTESCQILSSALRLNNLNVGYRLTHKDHPVVRWAALNQSNWDWLYRHAEALYDEYRSRYNKPTHQAGQRLLLELSQHRYYLPRGERTEFVNCAGNRTLGIDYTDIDDTVMAYRLYLNDRWDTDKVKPSWEGKINYD